MNLVSLVINHYKFDQVIGSGSFATVYKIEKDGKIFAAKVFSDSHIFEEFKENRNRITNEILALKTVKHDTLIEYIDDFNYIHENGQTLYIVVMEYFEGQTLEKILKERKLIDTDKSEICKKILLGLDALHNCNIIHRDLKPANILVSKNKEIKIIDYGLSKLINFSTITRTGDILGSPIYMSPEQIRDSKHIDKRSDLYSFGVILYNVYTNNTPYTSSSLEELIYKILNVPIIPPRTYDKNIDDNVETVIYKLLSKDNYRRFSNCIEVLDALVGLSARNEVYVKNDFFAWTFKEKKVLEDFSDKEKLSYIFPLHIRDSQKGLYNLLSRKSMNVIIDPSTQRLSYTTCSKVKGLMNLLYARKSGVLDLNYLEMKINRTDYIQKWFAEIKEFNNIILPYHYISNSNYSRDKVDNWIKLNVQLINESLEFLKNNGYTKKNIRDDFY